MKKAEAEKLKKIALLCMDVVHSGKINFGAGTYIVEDGTDQKIADVYGGSYNQTPISVMQDLCVAHNHVLDLAQGVLDLLEAVNINE